jgi:hypothetical protein
MLGLLGVWIISGIQKDLLSYAAIIFLGGIYLPQIALDPQASGDRWGYMA